MLSQPLKKKPLPKKPTNDNASEEDLFLENILPGEFHSDWERNLWGGDEPTNNPDIFYDVTGLDNFVHVDETKNHVRELLDSHSNNIEDIEAPTADNFVGQDPMMQDANLQVQGNFHVVTEDDNINRVVNLADTEVVMEINLDAISTMAPPNDAFIIAEASDNLPSEPLVDNEESISFNHTSFDSGFEDSFQGWRPENLEDTCHTMDISLESSPGLEYSREIETDQNYSVKKRVGRPPKRTKTEITTVPFGGPKKVIEQAKKRRLRDLNNIASQKCRAKKRQARVNEQILCQELESRNTSLKTQFESLEWKVKILRNYMIQSGIPVDQYQLH